MIALSDAEENAIREHEDAKLHIAHADTVSSNLGFQINDGLVGHIKPLCKDPRYVDEHGRVL